MISADAACQPDMCALQGAGIVLHSPRQSSAGERFREEHASMDVMLDAAKCLKSRLKIPNGHLTVD